MCVDAAKIRKNRLQKNLAKFDKHSLIIINQNFKSFYRRLKNEYDDDDESEKEEGSDDECFDKTLVKF